MLKSKPLEDVGSRPADVAVVAAKVAGSPEALSEVLQGLSANAADVRYGCARVLRAISEAHPLALYPSFDRFVELLRSDNKILQWQAIRIIANLSRVDSEDRVEDILDAYFAAIRGPVMITAANIIKGSATIALAKPHLTERIVKELLSVGKGSYQTAECRNIALGHMIEALGSFFEQVEDRKRVLRLVRRQRRNPRNATRRKAERFLATHDESPPRLPPSGPLRSRQPAGRRSSSVRSVPRVHPNLPRSGRV